MYRPRIATCCGPARRLVHKKAAENAENVPLYLNPRAWQGLPADRIFELHNMRKLYMGDKYLPNDDERKAILSTVADLKVNNRPELEYVYAIDNFKKKVMNNTPYKERGAPPKLSGIEVVKDGEIKHAQRKIDELTRVAAYEMPLLAKFRKPYIPKTIKETPLVLRFGDDFSNETSDFNRKVSLVCKLQDLDLNDKQQRKFKILAAQRFDHNNDEIRIASDRFPVATQNAKWLVETFNKLLTAAKDLKDDLSDIPIDTRHMKKQAVKHEFPESWKRLEDAPAERHHVMQKLVEKVKSVKDSEYVKSLGQ